MGKNKLRKFADLETYSHVLQPSLEDLQNGYDMRGRWKKEFFQNENPLVLELGCGKGEYSVGLGRKFPNKNFLGLDIKGARIWQGATQVLQEGLNNVGFLRLRIEFIEKAFAQGEVDEIWITFPDPQLKKKRANKRLTHPIFLNRYKNILQDSGSIHLKTDSQFLHGYTLGVIDGDKHILEDATNDLYNSKVKRHHSEIKTYYESIYLEKGYSITYLRFKLRH